jgi:hypothetical protein
MDCISLYPKEGGILNETGEYSGKTGKKRP